jgi:heme o synthase
MSIFVEPPTGRIELSSSANSVGVLSSSTQAGARWRDFLSLTKPRIAVMAMITVALGFLLGSRDEWSVGQFGHALFGISLVAAGCSALNQFWERDSDRLMARTANRPLPAGRLLPSEVLAFGLLTSAVGLLDLVFAVNLQTALLAAVTLLLYVSLYTPLKRRTSLCTALGAIPGAMPPVLGWSASGAELDAGAFGLFATLFVWQFPHFLAIAWLYREQYAAAGLRMLPQAQPRRRVIGWMCVAYALAVIPVSLLLKDAALAGDLFGVIALVLGFGYVASAVRFLLDESTRTARQLVWASLVYLPALLLALTWDHWRLLS